MDQQQLEQELEQLYPDSFAWALRCCYENEASAEEVLQNTYLKILEGKAKYSEKSTFKTWLFSVIRYTAIEYRRSTKQNKTTPLENIRVPEKDIQEEVDNYRKQAIFKNALNQLSNQQNQVLHLVFYQGCSIQEAAQIMNIHLGTARSHYERGKKQLKKWLTTRGLFEDIC